IGALANRDFVKMNGLGNEIVVVDLRGAPQPIEPAAARAAARQERYDQLMALYPARGNADAAVRIYNSDGSEAGACGNGMRRVTVGLAGGELAIEWRASDDHVLMTGPVAYEHKGRFDAALFADLGAA